MKNIQWLSILLVIVLIASCFICALAKAEYVTISWDPNSESDLAGYKIYYGPGPRTYSSVIQIGKINLFRIDMSKGTWYFAVTAFDTAGNESGYSEEVFITIQEDTQENDTLIVADQKWRLNYYGDAVTVNEAFMIFGGEAGFILSVPDDFIIYDLYFNLHLTGDGYCLETPRSIFLSGKELKADTTKKSFMFPGIPFRELNFFFDDDCYEKEVSDANISITNLILIRTKTLRPAKHIYFNWFEK